MTDFFAQLLNLSEYYDQIFGFITPIFDGLTWFMNNIVSFLFQFLLAFLTGGNFI